MCIIVALSEASNGFKLRHASDIIIKPISVGLYVDTLPYEENMEVEAFLVTLMLMCYLLYLNELFNLLYLKELFIRKHMYADLWSPVQGQRVGGYRKLTVGMQHPGKDSTISIQNANKSQGAFRQSGCRPT